MDLTSHSAAGGMDLAILTYILVYFGIFWCILGPFRQDFWRNGFLGHSARTPGGMDFGVIPPAAEWSQTKKTVSMEFMFFGDSGQYFFLSSKVIYMIFSVRHRFFSFFENQRFAF